MLAKVNAAAAEMMPEADRIHSFYGKTPPASVNNGLFYGAHIGHPHSFYGFYGVHSFDGGIECFKVSYKNELANCDNRADVYCIFIISRVRRPAYRARTLTLRERKPVRCLSLYIAPSSLTPYIVDRPCSKKQPWERIGRWARDDFLATLCDVVKRGSMAMTEWCCVSQRR